VQENIGSDRLQAGAPTLAPRFDYILIDCPPSLAADGHCLIAAKDGALVRCSVSIWRWRVWDS